MIKLLYKLGGAVAIASALLLSPLTASAAFLVPQGGTGIQTATAHGVLIGEGTSNFSVTSAGSSGQVLTSNGASADPTFQTLSASSGFATTSADYWLSQRSTTNVVEGTNLYWTNTRFDNRLSATTSLPNITTLANLGTLKTSLTGILKAASGVLSAASAGIDYITGSGVSGNCVQWGASNALTDAGAPCGTGSGGVTSVATNYPLQTTGATGAITLSTAFGTTTNTGLPIDSFIYTSHTGVFKGVASSSLALPNSALANNTISGVALGGTLFGLSHGSTITGTTYNGSATVSNWDIDVTHANTWSGLQLFSNTGTTTFAGPIQMQGWYIGTSTTVCLYPNTCQYQANSTAADVAIQAAITFVQNQGGGTVNIQPGTYNINAPITISNSGVVLKGEGNHGTILRAKNSLNDYVIKVNDAALRERLEFRNFKVDGNNSNQTSGGCIMASSTARSTFDDMWLEQCKVEALKLSGPAAGGFGYNNTVSNSYIANNQYGIVMINNDENQIFANVINSSSVYHIWDEQGLQNIHNNTFTGVVFSTGIGIYSQYTQNSLYENNTFDSVPQEAIHLLCNSTTQGHHQVKGNYVFKADFNGSGAAAIMVDGCVNNQIIGNYVDDNTTAPYAYQEVNNASINTYFSGNYFAATSSALKYISTPNASTTAIFNNATTTPPGGMYWAQRDATGLFGFNVPTGYSHYFAVNGTSIFTVNATGATSTNLFAGRVTASSAAFGGTSTTTISSTGAVVIPSAGSLTITGKTDGCATFATGVLNSTGSACNTGTVTGVTATYPIISSGGTAPVISTGFGTTTTWGMGNNGFVITGATGIPFVAASSTLGLPNTALLNSTISGIALGSTLNSFSVGSDFTGTSYNGSAAVSDWALKMSQAHSWTGLQSFLNASSSLLSVTSKAYFGGSATTTIDSAGNIVIPSGSNITVTGKTDGCATFATGVLNSTGSACGSGGGTGVGTISTSTTGVISNLLYYTTAGAYPEKVANVATSSFAVGAEFGYSGTLGALVGGTGGSLSLSANGVALSKLATIAANTVLGNPTGSTATPQAFATSSLFTGTVGQTAYFSGTGTLIGTSSLYIGTGSNVQIGTTTSSKLFIVEGNQSGGVARIQRDFGASPSQIVGTYDVTLSETSGFQDLTGPAQTFSISNNGGTPNVLGDIAVVRNGADTTGALSLRAYQAGTPVTFLTADGKSGVLGIGTSTPGALCALEACLAQSTTAGFNLIGGSATPVNAFFDAANTNARAEIGTVSNHPFWFYTNNTARGVITASGNFGIGTTTPLFMLQVSSSTAPQLSLTDASSGNAPWFFRAIGSSFYIGTSTASTAATSTNPAVFIDGTQAPSLSVGSTTPTLASKNGMVTLGANGSNGTSTISTGRLQFDTYNAAGTRSCAFIVGTAWVVSAGACNP